MPNMDRFEQIVRDPFRNYADREEALRLLVEMHPSRRKYDALGKIEADHFVEPYLRDLV